MKITRTPHWGILFCLALLAAGCSRPFSAPVPANSPIAAPVPGSTGAPLEAPTVGAEAEWPVAALVMRQTLAQQLGVAPLDIALAALEPVTWPDACLGAPRPSELCLPAETPGFRLVYTIAGDRFVYHTNADASISRLVAAPPLAIGEVAVTWRQTDAAGECRTAAIGADGVGFGPCEGVQLGGIYGLPTRRTDLADFVATYAPFTAATPAGEVTFHGRGSQAAAPAEERMLAEWARLVALEAQGGRSGASWGLAFAWNLEGGEPQPCASVTVYVTGEAFAADCAAQPPQTLLQARLSAAELQSLYTWLDTYRPFERTLPVPGRAAAEVRIVFSGAGSADAGEVLVQELNDFAQGLWAQGRPAR